MTLAETLLSCDPDDRMRIKVINGDHIIAPVEVASVEYTNQQDNVGSSDTETLIVHLKSISDLLEEVFVISEKVEDWNGILEISARQLKEETWTRPILQAWGTDREEYVEIGYVSEIDLI